jgi:flagellar biosynthesis protein FlhF
MQTKTYFASSVPAALELARKELGEDAMLVTSKPASVDARPFGRLEVTFAYEAKSAAPTPPPIAMGPRPAVFPVVNREQSRESNREPKREQYSAAEPFRVLRNLSAPAPIPAEPRSISEPRGISESRNLISEMDELRNQIAALRQAVVPQGMIPQGAARPASYAPPVRGREMRSGIADQLIATGLGADIADEIAAALRGNESPEAVAREIAGRIPVASFSDLNAGETRQVALVGPPGRGKTTTLVKLAVRFGLANRVPVKIYSAGSHGVGCEEQLARYASILGVPFQACESLEGLGLALNGEMWKGLVLIDTPGISPADSAEIGEFARFFKRRPEIERHLVLRADTRSADIANVLARFTPMEVSRLLFTGLDEAVCLGSMADALIRSRIPGALSGTGPRIPEDLETVSATRLVRMLHGESASAAAAA